MLFTTCKKYPEGGFTKRGPKNMLGEWTLNLYEVDGIDSTDLINYNGDQGYKTIIFKSDAPRDNNPKYMTVDRTNQRTITIRNSNKELEIRNDNSSSGKECVTYYFTSYKCYRIIFCPEGIDSRWQIQKLNKQELILTLQQSKTYQVKLSK